MRGGMRKHGVVLVLGCIHGETASAAKAAGLHAARKAPPLSLEKPPAPLPTERERRTRLVEHPCRNTAVVVFRKDSKIFASPESSSESSGKIFC